MVGVWGDNVECGGNGLNNDDNNGKSGEQNDSSRYNRGR